MKKFNKIFSKLLLFLVVTILVFIVIFSLGDFKEIMNTIKNAKISWLIIAFIALLLYFVLNAIPLYVLTKTICKKIKFMDVFLISSTEYFFNGITPFASGGKPYQVYAFNQIDVKTSESTGILLLNFVNNQLSIVILCFLSLIYAPYLIANVQGAIPLIIAGITINAVILIIFVGLGSLKCFRDFFTKIFDSISKWRIFKGKLDKARVSFDEYCDNVQVTYKHIVSNIKMFVLSFIIKLFATVLFYSIPLYVLKALGVDLQIQDLFFVVSMTTFAIAMTCFVPTPGQSGGIELAFKTLFASLSGMTTALSLSGMILWRVFSYYLLLIISFIIYLIFNIIIDNRKRKKTKGEI